MNYRMICRCLGMLLLCLAALLLLPFAVGLFYGENVSNFAICIVLSALAGFGLSRVRPVRSALYAREGFVIVALAWLLISLVGALPFVLSGSIPHYLDAFFETVSGFTTTGSSVIGNMETMPRGDLFWRQFTHWIGGMGVLVFVMAVLPLSQEHSMHIMRAEVPGPVVGKLVPQMRKTARILYCIYIAMTLLQTLLLLFGGLNLYDALLHAFATAGTGGFSTYAASVGHFDSVYVEMVCAVFMLLFSVNFNLYFFLLIGKPLAILKNEELRVFAGIVLGFTLLIALGIAPMYGSIGQGLRHAFFNVSAVISTTGFGTVDFVTWPEYTKWLLLLLMFCGACAGSTGGGMKVSRVIVLGKTALAELRRAARPRSVTRVRLEGQGVSAEGIHTILVFFGLYIALILGFAFVVSFDGYDITTSFTAALTCLSNVGPGMGLIGPTGNFSIFSPLSKLALSFAMLLGRLEIYPMLILLSRRTWRRG